MRLKLDIQHFSVLNSEIDSEDYIVTHNLQKNTNLYIEYMRKSLFISTIIIPPPHNNINHKKIVYDVPR